MNLAAFVALACMFFLGIFNGFLMGIGIGITIKGIFYYFAAVQASQDVVNRLFGIDDYSYYRLVALTYLLPGCMMIVVGIVGYLSSKIKLNYLAAYIGFLITSIGAKIKNPHFSLFAYFNRLFASQGDFGLLTGVVYPEYGMQIAFLVASFYLVCYDYYLKKLEEKLAALKAEQARLESRTKCSSFCGNVEKSIIVA